MRFESRESKSSFSLMRYRRAAIEGATYFFTLVIADRSSRLLTTHIETLRQAMRTVRQRHPFEIVAAVVLPDHLHAIWRLPKGDADFPLRWALIKAGFSRALPPTAAVDSSRAAKREREVWQRRYWEHMIRDETDLTRHVDYIHFNPVKHGHVRRAADWPYSTIHRYIERGDVARDWGVDAGEEEGFGE
jgi:putative transposase